VRVRHVILVALAAGTLSACASNVSGTGTGAGPRNAGRNSSAASSRAPSASTGSTPGKSSSASSGTHPVPSAPLRTITVPAQGGTTYVVKLWAETEVHDCAAHAYGPIVRFLRTHPCSGMRQVLATTTVDGRPVAFAQRSIGFRGGVRSYRVAGRFRELVTQNGTGNLNDLLREGYRLPSGPSSVPFPNAFSALAQDNSVTVVEAWYLDGHTPDNDPPLVRMAQDIFLRV
jgi:hypothetical protein